MYRNENSTPPLETVITLTLPTPSEGGIPLERATVTLLIQRGDLAHVRQFHYHVYLPDVMEAIREATEALGVLTDNPPVMFDPPSENPKTSIAMNLGLGIRSLIVACCADSEFVFFGAHPGY